QLEEVKKKIATGVGSQDDLVAKQREVLELRRQMVRLDLGPDETAASTKNPDQTAPTDAEEKEVQRIKAMIKDSPDLINSSGKNGRTPCHNAAAEGQLVV